MGILGIYKDPTVITITSCDHYEWTGAQSKTCPLQVVHAEALRPRMLFSATDLNFKTKVGLHRNCVGFRVLGLRFQGFGFWVYGLGLRVHASGLEGYVWFAQHFGVYIGAPLVMETTMEYREM